MSGCRHFSSKFCDLINKYIYLKIQIAEQVFSNKRNIDIKEVLQEREAHIVHNNLQFLVKLRTTPLQLFRKFTCFQGTFAANF